MAFNEYTKRLVWNKAQPRWGKGVNEVRIDAFGSLIRFRDYGSRQSVYGWEIDHITEIALGGTDAIWNLRPLNWVNNVRRWRNAPFPPWRRF
ncbi:HNH endonuclease signature motif containing protein [Thermodesulfobacteriota bacterium]